MKVAELYLLAESKSFDLRDRRLGRFYPRLLGVTEGEVPIPTKEDNR